MLMTSGVTDTVLEASHGREEIAFHGDEISLLITNMSLTRGQKSVTRLPLYRRQEPKPGFSLQTGVQQLVNNPVPEVG